MKKTIRAALLGIFLGAAGGAQAGALTICGAPLAPYAYLGQDGAPSGLDVDVAREVFGQLNVPLTIAIEPFARCIQALKLGAADAGFALSPTPERETFLSFPKQAVWQISYVFFASKQTRLRYEIHGLDDARRQNLRIGIVRGASYFGQFWDAFPPQRNDLNAALIEGADTAANFHQLKLEHIQLFPQDRVAGLWAARAAGIAAPDYYDTVLATKDYRTAFSKASRFSSAQYPDIVALMQAYDRQLEAFKKTRRYQALLTEAGNPPSR